MNKQLILQPTRLGQLLKREFIFTQKRILLFAGAVAGILFVIALNQLWDGDHDIHEFHQVFFPIVLLTGGFLFTSTCFNDLNNPQTGQIYLTLPASNFEKFLSKLLLTSIGFALAATILYTLLAILIGTVGSGVFDTSVTPFKPFSSYNLWYIGLYLVLQSLFLVGAIAFKRYSWVKTVLATLAIVFVVSGIFGLFIHLIFWSYFDGFFIIDTTNIQEVPSKGFQDFMEYQGPRILKFFLWIALPFTLWTVSYFKLKEKEI